MEVTGGPDGGLRTGSGVAVKDVRLSISDSESLKNRELIQHLFTMCRRANECQSTPHIPTYRT